ncbi:glycoside hydrolase family 47 protein [Plicaturopsis crispa FD-325 SS-3]|nr:glycoside hydrolase family 47 protein [Plicaturopsis crispa FD-325 SS-3]
MARWLGLCLTLAFAGWLLLAGTWGPPPRPPPPRHHLFDDQGRGLYGLRAGVRLRPQAGPPTVWSKRADKVRDAFVHAYSGYQTYAATYDELLPMTDGKVNNFNGWRVSVIDSLDTMWIMGLYKDFDAAMPIVANETFFLSENSYAPFFETVIRYLGGLLSAYALSGEQMLLSRADDLGRMLLPAMDTPSGFPMYAVNTKSGKTREGWNRGTVLWAEALSCQMEYKYLAHMTGRTQYFHKVEHLMQIMYNSKISDGQFPTMWNMDGTPKNTQFSVGAFADSAHEYLLKQWLLTGKSEPKAREMYISAASAIIEHLLYISPTRNLLYVTDASNGRPSHTFEHLSCFLPGLLALGVHTLALPPREAELHRWAAEGLANTCWMTYADQKTGLGPDEMVFDPWPVSQDGSSGRWMEHVEAWEETGRPGGVPPGLREVSPKPAGERDYRSRKSAFLLRPETLESFYIMWRTTGDKRWRERGWKVFEAIERETKTPSGYASINNVDVSPSPMRNEMPSYFLAETLKYLYLLFTDAELIPLDAFVFNTEGHPLPIFRWSDWEMHEYDIEH